MKEGRGVISGDLSDSPCLLWVWQGKATCIQEVCDTGNTKPKKEKEWKSALRHFFIDILKIRREHGDSGHARHAKLGSRQTIKFTHASLTFMILCQVAVIAEVFVWKFLSFGSENLIQDCYESASLAVVMGNNRTALIPHLPSILLQIYYNNNLAKG